LDNGVVLRQYVGEGEESVPAVTGGALAGIDAVHRGDQPGGHGPVQRPGEHEIALLLKVLAFLRGEGELQAAGIHDAAWGEGGGLSFPVLQRLAAILGTTQRNSHKQRTYGKRCWPLLRWLHQRTEIRANRPARPPRRRAARAVRRRPRPARGDAAQATE